MDELLDAIGKLSTNTKEWKPGGASTSVSTTTATAAAAATAASTATATRPSALGNMDSTRMGMIPNNLSMEIFGVSVGVGNVRWNNNNGGNAINGSNSFTAWDPNKKKEFVP
eukprot:13649020-Ditylum_brightwellii.AAC.1